jgi:hypothetical protein
MFLFYRSEKFYSLIVYVTPVGKAGHHKRWSDKVMK